MHPAIDPGLPQALRAAKDYWQQRFRFPDLASMTAMMVSSIAVSLADAGKKLGFLRKNFLLLMAWPIAALILGAIGWSALFANLGAERQRAENEALKEAAALSGSYSDNLARTMDLVDQILLHVRYEWLLSGGQLQLEKIKQTRLFPPSILEVAIIDRNGMLLTSTIPDAKTKETTFADRPYFLFHKNNSADVLHIGEPILSPVTNRYIIPLTRRLAHRAGDFSGVIVVPVVPGYLTANYDETELGKHGLLGVLGSDGVIRATRTGNKVHPPAEPALVQVPRFASAPGGTIILEGNKWFADRRTRYVGWDAVERYPLIALVGLDQQEKLAQYWAARTAAIRHATWATIALAAFTLIATALSLQLVWRKYKMESAQASYRMATEEGKEGFYIAHPLRDAKGTVVDFEIIDSNHRGAEMLRERREELIGKKISALYQAAHPERLTQWLRQAMDRGLYEADVEVPGESSLTMRWAHIRIVRADSDLAITLRDISDTKAHVAELERRGNEDFLTALPNRHWAMTYLPRAIEHAAQGNAMLALLFVDLDGFKKVNDTMGHAAGDELLRNAARRIKDAVRPHDHVVRLGGDEFLVIIEQIEHKMDAAHVAERVVHAFKESFRLSQGVHSVGTSIGISVFPSDGTDASSLLHNADIAMYSVKTSGKGNYRFYDQKFYDALRARLEQEAELRNAIEHDQFILYYQPRVDISTGTIASMEALVRWAHPLKGLVEPIEFIPLAEETGLILSLGELIIDKVCAQLAYWSRSGRTLAPVSINISSRQFNEADVADILSKRMSRHHIDSGLVEVEVTESSMMGSSADVSGTLAAIRKMGIKLLVDDFGTGYSSLSQLQRLDFDMLKVDQAFTAEIGRSERGNIFFKAIITMAHALGMRVVAEGVENDTQINILRSLHCDEIQGFYVSMPSPASEMQPVFPKRIFPTID
jgi:diguanylate cyclase (GGDEF)-like protein